MSIVKPFPCLRPSKDLVSRVAALPYDVYNRAEARVEVTREPISFLAIDRPETQFPEDTDMYSLPVYQKAGQMIKDWTAQGIYLEDKEPCFFLYEEVMDGRAQTGIVGCSSIDDYVNNVILKHEKTREEKELDRIRHIDICNAQTGPIFLAFRNTDTIRKIMAAEKAKPCLYDFVTREGIGQRVWRISDPATVAAIEEAFKSVPHTYIADGHHRAASAVKVGLKRREELGSYSGDEPFNTFLSVLFPEDELKVMDYNRVVKDLNGFTDEDFLKKLGEDWDITPVANADAAKPAEKLHVGMLLNDQWYSITPKNAALTGDPVHDLDVSILQERVLAPILGIGDPRTDKRIDFIGGIRGLKELERRCHTDMKIAFAMHPTSMNELFAVADKGLLMPPKSTWFEPKLLSGIFIHQI